MTISRHGKYRIKLMLHHGIVSPLVERGSLLFKLVVALHNYLAYLKLIYKCSHAAHMILMRMRYYKAVDFVGVFPYVFRQHIGGRGAAAVDYNHTVIGDHHSRVSLPYVYEMEFRVCISGDGRFLIHDEVKRRADGKKQYRYEYAVLSREKLTCSPTHIGNIAFRRVCTAFCRLAAFASVALCASVLAVTHIHDRTFTLICAQA